MMGVDEQVNAQYTTDTLYNSTIFSGAWPFSYYRFENNYSLYTQTELAAKGIVPGVTIYGIAYYKTNNASISPTASAILEIKYRTGSPDTSFPLLVNYSVPYLVNNYFSNGYVGFTQYTSGNNLNIPSSPGWLPFLCDVPFVYSGGSLNIFTKLQASQNWYIGSFNFRNYGSGINAKTLHFCSTNGNSYFPTVGSTGKPSIIIYHSVNPNPCNGTPLGGTAVGPSYVCKNRDFSLFLLNPSAGPGISYQWQQAPIGSSVWTPIAGATLSSANFNISTPTQFHCEVTCANSGMNAVSSTIQYYPFAVHIDSISHSVSGNMLSVHCFSNDTSSTSPGVTWNFGDSATVNYYGTQVQKTYTVDGTYLVKAILHSDCSSDSLTIPITIGCTGSPTFVNTLSAIKDTTCLSKPATLKINDTLPSNYTVEWYRFTGTGNILLGTSSIGNYNVSVSAPSNIFFCKAICNLSTNFKYSNYDTVYITPPPTAGTITATNTNGNYYTLTNNGMSNAQSYKWYFGDGDSSSSLSPSHHYNLAGFYTVHFVVTNAGNGCTDTAGTVVHITTGIEDIQGKLFSVSPNPFKETITIICPSGKGTIIITDAVGKTLLQSQIINHQSQIDMKQFVSGIYFIKYQNDKETETIKVIKQ
jgi:PKD repeat protein